MRPSIWFGLALGAILWFCGPFAFYGQAQTAPPHCSADDSTRDESGFAHCCPNGSAPNGESQCWCEPQIVHLLEYRNPKYEYEVRVPDRIAEILGCSGIGTGFKISLTHPDSGKNEGDLNMIWVGWAQPIHETFEEMADKWAQNQREDSDRVHATDLQLDPPEQTALSSLPALHLKMARTETESGKMIQETVIANNPDKGIAYVVGMVTTADQYDKNQKLFKAIVDGFRYVPSEPAPKQ